MKVIPSSKRHHYFARVIIFFLIVAGLIVWMTGCYTCFPEQYTLIISSTEGGSVTDPEERTFTYNSGTVVDLVATPDAGYHFVEWTGDVSTIADVYAAATNITMNGSYNITANFALEIWDWYDLDDIRNNLSGSYILMNDLDSTTPGYEELASPTANGEKGWQPIGYKYWDGEQLVEEVFQGTFDGQGYEIRDLFIDLLEYYEYLGVGLFGCVGGGGVVNNIGVVNATVTGHANVGGLVGENSGTVNDCHSTGSVTGIGSIGGLVGFNEGGAINNSYATGSVVALNNSAGGLVGWNDGTVSDSYATCSVIGGVGVMCVGGLVGFNEGGTVSNSYSTGSVTSENSVGGLVGENFEGGTIINSYSTSSVTGNFSIGGLVGENTGTVSNSFWDTETSGQGSSAGGEGKTTAEMHDIDTFSGVAWDICAVGGPSERNPAYIWNIVDDETYPFLSWEP